MAAGVLMGSIRLMTEYGPGLFAKLSNRWHPCEGVRVTRDRDTGYYVLEVTGRLAAEIGKEAQELFDRMDAA